MRAMKLRTLIGVIAMAVVGLAAAVSARGADLGVFINQCREQDIRVYKIGFGDSTHRRIGHGLDRAFQAAVHPYLPQIGRYVSAQNQIQSDADGDIGIRRRGTNNVRGQSSSLPTGFGPLAAYPTGWNGPLGFYAPCGTLASNVSAGGTTVTITENSTGWPATGAIDIEGDKKAYSAHTPGSPSSFTVTALTSGHTAGAKVGFDTNFTLGGGVQIYAESELGSAAATLKGRVHWLTKNEVNTASGFTAGWFKSDSFSSISSISAFSPAVNTAKIQTGIASTDLTLTHTPLVLSASLRQSPAFGLAFGALESSTSWRVVGPCAIAGYSVINEDATFGLIQGSGLDRGGHPLIGAVTQLFTTNYKQLWLWELQAAIDELATSGRGTGAMRLLIQMDFGHNEAGWTEVATYGYYAFCNPALPWTVGQGTTISDAGGISDSDTTIGLTPGMAATLQSVGIMKIENEWIKWANKSGNNLTSCTRGMFGTTAASHADATAVYIGHTFNTRDGFKANLHYFSELLSEWWVEAGGSASDVYPMWVTPVVCWDDEGAYDAADTSSTLSKRQAAFNEFLVAAKELQTVLPNLIVLDVMRESTVRELVEMGWSDLTSVATTGATFNSPADPGTITVTQSFATIGYGVIGSEKITWTGRSGSALTGVSGGQFGTTKASQASSSQIAEYDLIHAGWPGYRNSLQRAVNRAVYGVTVPPVGSSQERVRKPRSFFGLGGSPRRRKQGGKRWLADRRKRQGGAKGQGQGPRPAKAADSRGGPAMKIRLFLVGFMMLAWGCGLLANLWAGDSAGHSPGAGEMGGEDDPPIECEWKEETLYVWIEGETEPIKNSDIWPIRNDFMFGGCVDPGLPGNDPYGPMPYLIPW